MIGSSVDDVLIDELLYILASQRSKRAGRNVKQLKRIRDMQPHVACKRAADFVDVDIQHDLRPRIAQGSDKMRGGIQNCDRSPNHNRIVLRVRSYERNLKNSTHQGDNVIEILLRGAPG